MRKNLGIIQINLPNVTLDDNFNGGVGTTITSLLSEEQKLIIIRALKGDKIVVLNGKITDDSGVIEDCYNTLLIFAIMDGTKPSLTANFFDVTNDIKITFTIFDNSGDIIIYS